MGQEYQDDIGVDILRLVEDAVGVILEHEDVGVFRKWLFDHIRDYFPSGPLFPAMEAGEAEVMARGLLREIWNAVPLPGNGFRPSPIPRPARNEPCFCGSGKKFKRCCARLPETPPLPGEAVWPFVVERLDDRQVAEAVGSKRVPLDVLAMLAEEHLDEGTPEGAVDLLEPLFFPAVKVSTEFAGLLLDELCNAYGDMSAYKKKTALLEHVLATAGRSPLRSAAHQRSAVAALDRGDVAAAWRHFKAAMQDAPGSAGLSILETQILLFEKRFSEAADRARFWIAKLGKDRYHDYEPLVTRLQQVVDDPEAASGFFLGGGGLPEFLPELIRAARERPLAQYACRAIEPLEADSPEALKAEILSRLPGELPEGADVDDMIEKLFAGRPEDEPGHMDEDEEESFTLVPPDDVADAEVLWRDLFLLEKPFSVHWLPFEYEDVWLSDGVPEWTTFLNEHPEAFDSLDIMDDLATAILALPGGMDREEEETLLVPVLQRARRIVLENLPSGVVLDWRDTLNRPAIRPVARLALLKMDREEEDAEFHALVEESLRINPNDNFGLRGCRMNYLVRSGRNQEALELASRYPDDMQAELPYGSVLALYRMGDKDRAAELFLRAFDQLPNVAKALVRSSMKQPEMNPNGIRIGGADQAWLYRDAMRDEWRKTRGILTWMKGLMRS